MKRIVRTGSPEALKIIGDSSPCSAETSFRELDDVFLQTQTRIWLGEVLHIRFDEETAIADLLADGELLFQVSKVVWKMLLKKHVELKHSKVYIYERTSFGKSDGRYMPYPKVDSFLKICQILGLTGVDLFSPSDIVEKRDVRRVCMCIRSLSKKARSKNLNVPDFDIVTYTIAMPTDLVGGICRNLEQSQCSSSSSNGCSSPSMDPREIYRQKSPSGQYARHYDSCSESDEAESTFTEFEFQSPLSTASYDANNLSNISGENSPEGNLVVDGNLSELQTGFRLESQDQNEVGHESTTENGSHEFTVRLLSKSSSPCTESQIDGGSSGCFVDVGEVMWPSSNPKTHKVINNVDIGYYENFASTYGDPSYELDEPLAVNAEEACTPFGPMLGSESLENCLPKSSTSNCNINLDHPKELKKASVDPSAQVQTVICRLGDDDVRSEYMEEDSNNGSIFGFRDMVHEKILLTANIVDDEGKKENSSINTLKISATNSVNKISLPGNYIGLKQGTSNLILHGIENGNGAEVPASSFSLSMETVDSDRKDIKNGLKRKAVDEVSEAQAYCTASLISSEDKFGNNDCTANNFSFPQVHSLREIELCDPALEIFLSEHVFTAAEEAMKMEIHEMDVNGRNLFKAEKFSSSVEIDGIGRDAGVLIVSSTCDNEGSYARRETEDMDSTRTFSSTAERKQTSLGTPNDPPLDSDRNSMSCEILAFIENDQDLPSQSQSLCDPYNTQCATNSFTSTTISDDGNGNEFKYLLSPNIPCTCGGTLEEGGNLVPKTAIPENKDTSTSYLEMDANEQLNGSIMSTTHEAMASKMYSSTTSNGDESQLVAVDPYNGTVGELNMRGVPQKDASYHPCETYTDLIEETKENYTEKIFTENSSYWHTQGDSTTLVHNNTFSISNADCSCRQQIILNASDSMPMPLGNDIVEREALSNLGSHHMDESEIHGVETGRMNSSVDLNVVCTRISNVLDSIEPTEESVEGNNRGVIPLMDDVSTSMKHKEEDYTGKRKKDTEECEKQMVAKLDSSGKDKERASGNKVLKSVVGAMALIGALFLLHHIRRKRDQEKNSEIVVPQQTHQPRQEVSTQKRVENGKSDVLYPGERLEF